MLTFLSQHRAPRSQHGHAAAGGRAPGDGTWCGADRPGLRLRRPGRWVMSAVLFETLQTPEPFINGPLPASLDPGFTCNPSGL